MSHEPPKLYVHKPKKARSKQSLQKLNEMQASTPAATALRSATTAGAGGGGFTASVPPDPPRESFARRYRFLWPLLLGMNVVVGVYMYTRTRKKDTLDEEEAPAVHASEPPPAPPIETPSAPPLEAPSPSPPMQLVKRPEPIPENQQRELFEWILDEKRKIKAKDREEKRIIDEQKAILKQFIRAKSIPTI